MSGFYQDTEGILTVPEIDYDIFLGYFSYRIHLPCPIAPPHNHHIGTTNKMFVAAQILLAKASKNVRIDAVRRICDPKHSNRELSQSPDSNKPFFWHAAMEVDEDTELDV